MGQHEFTLAEVVDLERPAWHVIRSGAVDYIYDGINFWCGKVGNPCPTGGLDSGATLPLEGWRHKEDCKCPPCREARRAKRARRRKEKS